MPTIDAELAQPLGEHLRERGVTVQHGTKVHAIGRAPGGLTAAPTPSPTDSRPR